MPSTSDESSGPGHVSTTFVPASLEDFPEPSGPRVRGRSSQVRSRSQVQNSELTDVASRVHAASRERRTLSPMARYELTRLTLAQREARVRAASVEDFSEPSDSSIRCRSGQFLSSSQVRSSSQARSSELADVASMVPDADRERRTRPPMARATRLPLVQAWRRDRQMLGLPFSGLPINELPERLSVSPLEQASQNMMTDQERDLQAWLRVGLARRRATLERGRSVHDTLDQRQMETHGDLLNPPPSPIRPLAIDEPRTLRVSSRANSLYLFEMMQQGHGILSRHPLPSFSDHYSLEDPNSLGSIRSLRNGTPPIRLVITPPSPTLSSSSDSSSCSSSTVIGSSPSGTHGLISESELEEERGRLLSQSLARRRESISSLPPSGSRS